LLCSEPWLIEGAEDASARPFVATDDSDEEDDSDGEEQEDSGAAAATAAFIGRRGEARGARR
jgi:hypothetical protein